MSFGTKITKIGLQTTHLVRNPTDAVDNPGDNHEFIRRDPYGTDTQGSFTDHKEIRCCLWVEDGASGWASVQATPRIRSARIQLHVTEASSDTNNTVDFHKSNQTSDNIDVAHMTWDLQAFRQDWLGASAGGAVNDDTKNSTSIPGGLGRWSGNAREATKSMTSTDYPLWIGKLRLEAEPLSADGDDMIRFYDENVVTAPSRPYLVLKIGNGVVPRRIHAHRRRLT